MAKRNRAYLRMQRRRHIDRKKRIIKKQGDYWHYAHEGELDKGKIHCPCPMCRHKSYDRAKMTDARRSGGHLEALQELGPEG
ncbi:MAG: hypothetical protein NC311_14825, partial [Muribaculaceae bacterium]|nr:hypothetical protein [Muribaculaceae bacterium]